MISKKAHEISDGIAGLNAVARRLHGKNYTALSDAEADAVWDDIDPSEVLEIPEQPACETPGTTATEASESAAGATLLRELRHRMGIDA